MNNKQTIKADGAEFCSEIDYFRQNALPKGIINKKITGCGMTTVALENEYPTILAVPTQELIKNKVEQYPNERFNQHIIGFYCGNNNIEALEHYINAWETPKIVVTYNSFYKVAELVKKQFPEKEFRVVVDEFSEFLDAYDYRSDAIDSIRESLRSFEYVSYISATPTKFEYLPDELKNLLYSEIDWGDRAEKVYIESIETNDPYKLTIEYIKEYKKEKGFVTNVNGIEFKSEAAYFFLNSVNDTLSILKNAELDPEEVRIICAHNEKNEKTFGIYKKSMGKALDTLNNEKPFNFITSAAFKGVDFFSTTGVCFAISNVKTTHTLTSIDTDLVHIAGRIRTKENPFRNKIYHIYNTGNKLSETKMQETIITKEKKSHAFIGFYNKSDSEGKKLIIEEMIKPTLNKERYLYYNKDQDIYQFNSLAKNNDLRKMDTVLYTYKNGSSVIGQYKENNFKGKKQSIKMKGVLKKQNDKKYTNKELFEWYSTLCIGKIDKDQIPEYMPEINDYVKTFGIEKIRKLNYNVAAIRREMNKNFNESMTNIGIRNDLRELLKKDKPYTGTEIKRKLAVIYGKYGIHSKPKGSDLFDIFGKENIQYKSFRSIGNSKAYVVKNL